MKDHMRLRMKNFNIGVHPKIQVLSGVSQKTIIYRTKLPKIGEGGGLGQCADLGGPCIKERGVFLRRSGVDTPLHTMRHNKKLGK